MLQQTKGDLRMAKPTELKDGFFIAPVCVNSNGQRLITIPRKYIDIKDGGYVKVFRVD